MWSIVFIVAILTADAFGQNDAGNCVQTDDDETSDCSCEEKGYFVNFEGNCEKDECTPMTCGANQSCKNNKCDCLPGFKNVAYGGPKQCVRPIVPTISTTSSTQSTTLLSTSSTTPLTQSTTLMTQRTTTTTMTPSTAVSTSSSPPIFTSTTPSTTLNMGSLNNKINNLSMLGIWDITGVLILVACLSGYVGYACHRRRYGAYLLAPPSEDLNEIQIRK